MISQNIQAARKALGLTQEDLANRLSVARQTVAKWESGESLPDLENAYALAKLLGVSVDDLIAHNEAATGYPIPPRGKHIFGIVRMGERGQIVIPKGARELFSIQPGDQLLLMADKKRGIALVSMDDLNVPDALFRMAKEAEDDADPEA